MSIKDITIVITSFNSDAIIRSCINSINKQCHIILIENSNNLKFKQNIEKEFPNLECFLAGDNLGYSKANNIGLKKVKTKYALILNPDARLQSSNLENFINAAKSTSDFAILGPYNQNEDMDSSTDLKKLSLKSVNRVKGFAMFLNLSDFKEVGFFDEDFFIYFEEIDLCRRLINFNKKIYLVANINIDHSGGQSHNQSINREMELSRNWHWMWSTFNYHKKYKGFFVSFMIIFPKLMSAILKFLFYSILLNKDKKQIYYQRYSGLINAIIGKSSWYRPKV